jgi:hypothetical protein
MSTKQSSIDLESVRSKLSRIPSSAISQVFEGLQTSTARSLLPTLREDYAHFANRLGLEEVEKWGQEQALLAYEGLLEKAGEPRHLLPTEQYRRKLEDEEQRKVLMEKLESTLQKNFPGHSKEILSHPLMRQAAGTPIQTIALPLVLYLLGLSYKQNYSPQPPINE